MHSKCSKFELKTDDRFRRRSGFKNIQEYLWARGLLRSRVAESSYILEGKAGVASMFLREGVEDVECRAL